MTEETKDQNADQRQKNALAAGRRAIAAGHPVIWIWGRPYPDPAAEQEAQEAQTESPFPWDE